MIKCTTSIDNAFYEEKKTTKKKTHAHTRTQLKMNKQQQQKQFYNA
jgi:hypothetical protein